MTTIAATMSGIRPPGAGRADLQDETAWQQAQPLGRAQVASIGVAVALSAAVAAYGLAGSYMTISDLAARHNVPLAGFVPAGIDGGLVAVVVLDLVLTWVGTPIGWLRQLARVLSVGTVAANAVSAWPDPVATGLHAAAPLMLLATIEAARTVMLRRVGQARGMRRDAIPPVRWALAPWRTFLLWRRMALWQITSYRRAVDTELELRRAATLLRTHYGRRWRRCAPADLVWMLRTGAAVDEACARVHALAGLGKAGCVDGELDAPARDAGNSDSSRIPDLAINLMRPVDHALPQTDLAQVDGDRFAVAMRLNRQHWIDTGRPISAETLRQRLHVSADTSRELTRAVRAADRAAVIAAGVANVAGAQLTEDLARTG